jgi:spoIIIJ-associated protein|tara:strand:- start:484 stop:1140 length:657 start_codon:yes stop_codon:yes gene_type:complete
MEELEVGAKTVDEAIEQALDKLGLDRSEVEINIISKGKAGIFGFGAEEAKVVVKRLTGNTDMDVAAFSKEVLSELLALMNVSAEIDVRENVDEHTKVLLDVSGADLGILIGRRGDTLSSLQYLVNLIVSRKLMVNAGVTVDVEHYREHRYESLRNLALRVADEVKSTDRSISLEPMPSNERRIVHLSLREHPDVATQSVGHGEGRKVVISLKDASQLP